MDIISGTTPTLVFKFNEIRPQDIGQCYLLIKQNGQTVVEKTITDSVITTSSVSFTLTQTDTFALAMQSPTRIVLDWKTRDGVRGRSAIYECTIKSEGKSDVY